MTIPDHIATEPMPEWAVIRYSEAVKRATTNARKPWIHVFTWEEVNSFTWEIAWEVWKTWEAPHVRVPERYATSDLRLKTMNRLDSKHVASGGQGSGNLTAHGNGSARRKASSLSSVTTRALGPMFGLTESLFVARRFRKAC